MKEFKAGDFDLRSFDDEVRVDERCRELLQLFHRWLLVQRQLPPLEAGALAAGTDYLLRDFVIDHCRENICALSGLRVRQFGGTWYILKNLEPNLAELQRSLRGIALFADFACGLGLLSTSAVADIRATAADEAWYADRIASFHDISGDGYFAWERACSLSDVGRVR